MRNGDEGNHEEDRDREVGTGFREDEDDQGNGFFQVETENGPP